MPKKRLNEGQRDLLRVANETLAAARHTLARAETAWKTALNLVLFEYGIEEEKMQELLLQDDFKWVEYEPKKDEPKKD